MLSKIKIKAGLTIFIAIMQFSKLSTAQSVTIGGTPSDGPSAGFMSMFTGDLFANFRHMERFAPVSTMTPSPNPWKLNPASTKINLEGNFLGQQIPLEKFLEIS